MKTSRGLVYLGLILALVVGFVVLAGAGRYVGSPLAQPNRPPAIGPASSGDCAEMQNVVYESVSNKRELERLIEHDIRCNFKEKGHIDWDYSIRNFRERGKNFSVEFIPNGGFENADIIRFTIDNTNIFTKFRSVPGASNDIFTAIVNRTLDGRVAIVERGGHLRWLKLE